MRLRSVCFSMLESLKEISLFNILNNSFGTVALTLGSVGLWPFQSSLFACCWLCSGHFKLTLRFSNESLLTTQHSTHCISAASVSVIQYEVIGSDSPRHKSVHGAKK